MSLGYSEAQKRVLAFDFSNNEYEKAVVDRCYNELLPRWQDRLADLPTYLRDNCWAMMESVIVTLPPENSLHARPR